MVVQHNLSAMNSHRQLGINNGATSKNLEKLSSGFRINRAGDDAAGLAISEKMRGQIRGLDMATQNAQNGVSLIQTAEGALNETHAILQRMRELAVQSSNGTYSDNVDRENIDKEIQALKGEIERISTSTHYNGIKLIDGSMYDSDATDYATKNITTHDADGDEIGDGTGDIEGTAKEMTFQIGANGAFDQKVTLNVANMGIHNIGSGSTATATNLTGIKVSDVDVSTLDKANESIKVLDDAINQVSGTRAGLGALQNRLEHTINNLGVSRENLQAAESTIRDVDMAKELMEFTKNNILTQASQSMLAQTNQLPQSVLSLLK